MGVSIYVSGIVQDFGDCVQAIDKLDELDLYYLEADEVNNQFKQVFIPASGSKYGWPTYNKHISKFIRFVRWCVEEDVSIVVVITGDEGMSCMYGPEYLNVLAELDSDVCPDEEE